ncbi:MAG TPA: ATP-dependent 6-phosphofructokinase [Gemmatimonadota bacterium]|nr:ATP-dependent 6-phosphofructokinase [Gemmatimonadota bacterium]
MARRIAVLTSGGDAPGMNAAIRAVVRGVKSGGGEAFGVRRGFGGLLDDLVEPLGPRDVANILQRGGSILDTSREPRFHDPAMRRRAGETLDRHGLDGLIAIGGSGTQQGAWGLQETWAGSVLGVASTIDNDLGGTDTSIGFDTACNTALEAIDRIRDTANSLDRLFFIEVMGRKAGFIALEVAVGGGAEAVLLPEVELDTQSLVGVIRANHDRGKISCIVVVAEGAHPGGARGLLHEIEDSLEALGLPGSADARVTILGHIQRGGNPTVRDRVLASRLGMAAAHSMLAGRRGLLFGVRGNAVCETPFDVALSENKEIDRSLLEMVNVLAG